MKIITNVANGEVKVNFDANSIVNGGLEEIYDYLDCQSKTSSIFWEDDPLLLKRGVIIGYYNRVITTDAMAEFACSHLVKLIKKFEKE